MKSDPVITVLITSYNHIRYIRQCIDSVLNQTYPHLDIRVVDDCSADGSLEVLRSYGDRFALSVHERNLGMDAYNESINEAMRTAKGELYYRLDSDDYLEPDYFERMVNEFRRDPELTWVCGGLNVVDQNSRIVDRWEYRDWPTDPQTALARGWETCSAVMPHNGLIRTDFLNENKLYWRNFDFGWGMDVLFTIRAMQCSPRVRLINGPGLNWRVHGVNNSCDISRRVNLVIAVKEYYLDHIPASLYLIHPLLDQFEAGSPEYVAAGYFLGAADLYRRKHAFRVPSMFTAPDTPEQITSHLYLFDEAITRVAEKSLAASPRFEGELKLLGRKIEADKHAGLGEQQLDKGQPEAAREAFEQGLRKDAQHVPSLRGLGEVSFVEGDLGAAEQHTARALQLDPRNPRTLNNAGVLFQRLNQPQAAEQALLRAIQSDPGNEDAYCNLLDLYGQITKSTVPTEERTHRAAQSAVWLGANASEHADEDIREENLQLRQEALDKYTGRYADSSLRLLLHRPANGALRYLMDSWAECLNAMGVCTALLDWGTNTAAVLESFQPTGLITVADPAYLADLDMTTVEAYRDRNGLKVGQVTTLEHSTQPCDFYITFHLDPTRDEGFRQLDRPLISLPFGINPLCHYMRRGPHIWDYFFVGTNSRLKTATTQQYLGPVVQKYSGILAGAGWSSGLGAISIHEAAPMYRLARICPNYHLPWQTDDPAEVNERTYIIPACGGFELVDNPAALNSLFAPHEMASASSASEYHDMFAYFLAHPEERREYIRHGMRRVFREYTLFHILSRLIEFLSRDRTDDPRSEARQTVLAHS